LCPPGGLATESIRGNAFCAELTPITRSEDMAWDQKGFNGSNDFGTKKEFKPGLLTVGTVSI